MGQVVTRTKLVNLDTILASTGEIIEVPEKSVHGCRTQIVTKVRDAAKMAAGWSSVLETEDAMTLLHRVVFYGDHLESAAASGQLDGPEGRRGRLSNAEGDRSMFCAHHRLSRKTLE